MKHLIISVAGVNISLEELQKDVDAAKAKGYNHQPAFTVHTVQGLIDKINEIESIPKIFKEPVVITSVGKDLLNKISTINSNSESNPINFSELIKEMVAEENKKS